MILLRRLMSYVLQGVTKITYKYKYIYVIMLNKDYFSVVDAQFAVLGHV